ncbi:formyl peptide receptor 2-like [Engystomops pustulosus]|uniref:formyl peptide receptor 2-like n=1 Tax=Engystomops pustulosus TaxID=76066 RepID=UPI003AFA6DBB
MERRPSEDLQDVLSESVRNFDVSVWLNSGPNIEQNTSLFFEYESYNVFDHIPNMCIIWYSVTLILGVIGSGLVILITGFRMRTVNAVWFLNLAMADFITSLPLRISEWALYYEIYYDHFLCTVRMTILFINMLCSVYFMTVISIDRRVSIFWPIWTKIRRTPRLATTIAILIWILSLLLSVPYLVFNHAFYFVTECFPKFYDFTTLKKKKRNAMFITKNICMFAVPFAIIFLSYVLLFDKLKKIRKSKKSKRPFRVITTVIISFLICWFPYNTWSLIPISDRYSKIDVIFSEVFVCLAYFSSYVNPILYILFSQDLKRKFVKSIPIMLEKVLDERSDIDCGDTTATTMLQTVNQHLLVP